MKTLHLALLALMVPGLLGTAHAHTVDSVGPYRVEIGWMNEPVVSGETNGIEFYASPLTPCPDIEDRIKCAESQPFHSGIEGLKKTLKVELIYKGDSITLPLSPDHNTPGKYYAFVNPTVSGFYQANILGDIEDTPISLSMHPPKVEERSYIEFPVHTDEQVEEIVGEYYNRTSSGDAHGQLETQLQEMTAKQDVLTEEIRALRESAADQSPTFDMGFAGIGAGIVGIAIAVFALTKTGK